jgi:choline-sulfatase
MAAFAPDISAKRPNILLILTDQQRFDTIQALGSRFLARTPAMDSLVREGISFDNAFCTAPICSPSRATLLTGLYPSEVGVPGNLGDPSPPLSTRLLTVGKRLQQVGYETVYHGKWHLGGNPADHGFEIASEQSLDEATRLQATQFWKSRDWLDNAYRPFFHIVSFLNPHDLYFFDPREEVPDFTRPWPRDSGQLPSVPAGRQVDWSEAKWGSYFRFFEKLLERVDADIGETLHQFRCSGFFSNSWIIFASDHGDMAGEHNLPFKGPWMYDGITRVPLVIVPPRQRFGGPAVHQVPDPGITPGRRQQLCSLIDLVPTILDLGSVEAPADLPGRSLLPVMRDETASAPHACVFSEWHRPPVRMCRSMDWKYVLYLNGDEALYHLAEDPDEMVNLAADPTHAETKTELRAALEDHFEQTGDPFHLLKEQDFVLNPPKATGESPSHGGIFGKTP